MMELDGMDLPDASLIISVNTLYHLLMFFTGISKMCGYPHKKKGVRLSFVVFYACMYNVVPMICTQHEQTSFGH